MLDDFRDPSTVRLSAARMATGANRHPKFREFTGYDN